MSFWQVPKPPKSTVPRQQKARKTKEDKTEESESDSEEEDDQEEQERENTQVNRRDGGDQEEEDSNDSSLNIDINDEKWKPLDVTSPALKLPNRSTRTGSQEESLDDVLPKFGIRKSKVGYTGSLNSLPEAKDSFLLFFCDEIMTTYVDATNGFARSTRRLDWRELTVAEFKTFIAVVIHFGMVKTPTRQDAWSFSKRYGNEFVKSMLSRSRFEAILRCLHYMNTAEFTPAEKKQMKKKDPFYSVKPFLDRLAQNFLQWYNPDQKIDIDESCFAFKGRHRARCYNPSKPAKWHFKAYCLNDALTGYLCNFFMYQGKDEERPAEYSATEWPVVKLTQPEKFHNKNYILATDNWYSSFVLVLFLLRLGIHFLGTIRTNRAGVPKKAVFSKKGPEKKKLAETLR